MVKRPTGSGGEPSSPNCESSAGVKARHLQYSGRCFFKLTITCAVSTNPAPYFDANAAHRLVAPSITKVPKVRLMYEPRENMTSTTSLKKSPGKPPQAFASVQARLAWGFQAQVLNKTSTGMQAMLNQLS